MSQFSAQNLKKKTKYTAKLLINRPSGRYVMYVPNGPHWSPWRPMVPPRGQKVSRKEAEWCPQGCIFAGFLYSPRCPQGDLFVPKVIFLELGRVGWSEVGWEGQGREIAQPGPAFAGKSEQARGQTCYFFVPSLSRARPGTRPFMKLEDSPRNFLINRFLN